MYEYNNADWWKPVEDEAETITLTETEKKIAHYEKRAQDHWDSWKTYGSRTYLYHYKQANIKIRKLKGESEYHGQ